MDSPKNEKTGRSWMWLAWLLIPLVLGALLSLFIPRPAVGVIYLDDAIYSASARDLNEKLAAARENPDIKALVMVLNSPGGTVSDTESVYRELILLRQTKPVVTVIEGMAASGGYYLASGSDFVFSKASSEIGNIGVIGYLPDSPIALEAVYSTGPYKMWGMPREAFVREMEMLKRQFLQVVRQGRGERLKMTDEEILGGQIYTAGDALRLGLVDEFGSVSDGLEKAASLAGISHFNKIDLDGHSPGQDSSEPFFQGSAEGPVSSYPRRAGIYYLYVRPVEEANP